jgi:hypothetical protein
LLEKPNPSSTARRTGRWRPYGEKGPHGIPAAWLHISEEFTPLRGADDEHSHVEQPNDNKMTRESQDELKDAKDAKDANTSTSTKISTKLTSKTYLLVPPSMAILQRRAKRWMISSKPDCPIPW